MGDGDAGPGIDPFVDGLVSITLDDPDVDDVLHCQTSDGSIAVAFDSQVVRNSGSLGEVRLRSTVYARAWGPAGCFLRRGEGITWRSFVEVRRGIVQVSHLLVLHRECCRG